MNKKFILLLLCLLVLVPLSANAATVPDSLEVPQYINALPTDFITVRWTEPESITKLYRDDKSGKVKVFAEIDYKINDGPWCTEGETWGSSSDPITRSRTMLDMDSSQHNVNNVVQAEVPYTSMGISRSVRFNFKENTYSFRVRYIYQYYADKKYNHVVSPFSEIVSVGKNIEVVLPDTLEAPLNPKAELLMDNSGIPYFSLSWDIPESVTNMDRMVKVWPVIDWKAGDGKWASEGGGNLVTAGSGLLKDSGEVDPIDTKGFGEVNIEAKEYSFRVFFKSNAFEKSIVSPFSEIISLGTPVYQYKNASSWAISELNKASEYDFITDKIRDNMQGPITREEFSEVVVRLYEKVTGEKATYQDTSAFSDTSNPEIYKAYTLKIVNGVGGGEFAPNLLITREQIAAMMHRAVKAMKPDADFSTDGVKAYPDESLVSGWVLPSVKFMSKNGLMTNIKGDFVPQGTTTREQAVVIVVRTFEKYSN